MQMPTINSYLTTMQSNLYVNGKERESIKKSIDAIYDRLGWYFGMGKNNPHKIIKKEIFGSYSRDTMLSRKYDNNSDIDLMIIFEDSKDYNPQTCLNWLKNFAEYWYPNSLVKQSERQIVTVMGIHTKEFGMVTQIPAGLLEKPYYEYLNELAKAADGVIASSNFQTRYGYKVGDTCTFYYEDGTSKVLTYVGRNSWADETGNTKYTGHERLDGSFGVYWIE